MHIKTVVLLMFALVLSAKSYASDCVKCNEGLIKDRAQLEQLVTKLKSFGVHADISVMHGSDSSRLEEHAVLEAKIVHFQKQLHELVKGPHHQ